MISFYVILQITFYASCKLHTLQMVEIWEGCGGATEDRQVSSFSKVCRKIWPCAKYQGAAQKNQKQDSINFNLCLASLVVQLWLGSLFQPKVGVKLWRQFSSATLEDPPICLHFLCPSRWSYMVGWGWSGNSTSTSKAFPWGALMWEIYASKRLLQAVSNLKWNAAVNCSQLTGSSEASQPTATASFLLLQLLLN